MVRSMSAAFISILMVCFATACSSEVGGGGGGAATPENHCLLDGADPVAPAQVQGAIEFYGDTSGALPALGGGDPIGGWAVDSFSLYLPDAVSSAVNVEASTLSGRSWVEMTADGQFRLSFDLLLRILVGETPIIDNPVIAGGIGSYTMGGNSVQISEDCFFAEGLDEAQEMGTSGTEMDTFDRNINFESTGDTGRFLIRLNTDFGELALLMNVSRR